MKNFFSIFAVGVEPSCPKKADSKPKRCERVYKRAAKTLHDFFRKRKSKGKRADGFLPQAKNKPEQSELCSGVTEEEEKSPCAGCASALRRCAGRRMPFCVRRRQTTGKAFYLSWPFSPYESPSFYAASSAKNAGSNQGGDRDRPAVEPCCSGSGIPKSQKNFRAGRPPAWARNLPLARFPLYRK